MKKSRADRITKRYGAEIGEHFRSLRSQMISELKPMFGCAGFGKKAVEKIAALVKPPFICDAAWERIGKSLIASANGANGIASDKNIGPDGKTSGMRRRQDRDNVYRAYLASPHWKKTRSRIIVIRGGKCERCGSKKHPQVHHLTYERRGCERDEDLMLLCRVCHEREHGLK